MVEPRENGSKPTSRRRLRVALAGALVAALALCVLAPSASAKTVTVTSLADSGAGSLREALKEASTGDTINVPAGTITLGSPLEITKSLTVVGAGEGLTMISGNHVSRVLTITGEPTVTLRRLAIIDGVDKAEGGGIEATGALTLQEVLVAHNRAGGGTTKLGSGEEGFGGGIQSAHGSLTLIDSNVSDNVAGGGGEGGDGFGGGINYESGANGQSFTLTLTGSTVSGNTVGGGPESLGFGGGIGTADPHEGGSITVSLSDSVVAGNTAGANAIGFGGGLLLESGGNKNALTLTAEDSAVTGNRAGGGAINGSGFGGGIDIGAGGEEVTERLTATNSTIAANVAGGGAKEANGFGGGIAVAAGGTGSTSTAALSYVTVAGNSAGGGGGTSSGGGIEAPSATIGSSIVAANTGGNCESALTSSGHNVDDGNSCGFKAAGDKSGAPALLGALGEHGGPGSTEMPLAGSPAIDQAERATCPATDQRGVVRPQGGGCDIGAVEVPPPSASTGGVLSAGPESANVGATIDPNFSETIYHFDYGTTSAYGRESTNANAGSGGVAVGAAAALSGLKPSTAYHYRVVAINAAGTVVGADGVFKTAAKPPAKPAVVRKPSLFAVSLTRNRFRVGSKSTAIAARRAPVGTSFKFRLTAAATMRITFTRALPGLRHGRSCVAPTAKLKRAHAKRCTRTLTVGSLTRAKLSASGHTVAFSGRIGRRALAPGAYTAVLLARNNGGSSSPVSLHFTIVR